MCCRLLLVGCFFVSCGLYADPVDPPELGSRGTWTETRADIPDVIFVHRNGHVMEVMRVPGTGTNGIPLQLVGPSEVSMKWVGAPTNWPAGITVLSEEPQHDGIIRVQVDGDAAAAATDLAAMPEVLFAYPVEFTDPMFARILPTDRIIARLQTGTTPNDLVPFGLEVVEPMIDSSVEYIFRILDPKLTTPDDMVLVLEGSGLVEWVQRDCIREAEFYYTPTDPQFANQWHLHANSQVIGGFTAPNDVDVNAPGAWNTTRGSASVKVAVIDDAIATTHPDLAANIDTTPGAEWDFFYNDNNADPDVSMLDMHGTAVAGVVGAVENNAIGVVGMAHQSPIVPIKVADGSGNFPYDSGVANSVRHAANYADIITCSWGYVNPAPSTLSSVRYALQSGAGGKGSIVFFATGNDAGYIPHMATLGAAGSYNLRWRYTKDASVSAGLDRTFVDSVWYPDGTQEMFDGLALPGLPAGMTSGGVGAWNSLAQFAGARAESGTGANWQFIGSPTALTHSQSTYVQITKNAPAPATPMWYYMHVDAQPVTYVGNTATIYDYGQFEYQTGGGSWTVANVQGGQMQSLSYPAADPETIAVGANDVTGRRSHYSQWDTGGALDFVAPSDGAWAALGIETTDLVGGNGYSSGNYCLAAFGSKFGGTSSATPLAAGIGALVRSVNGGLSPSQVRNVLRASCKKIDPTWYPYGGILGGRNQHVGWGQVDASNAVALAQNTLPILFMANDIKITEVSPLDFDCPFVEIYNSSMVNGYQLDTVMLTDCETGGDQGESSYQFAPGSFIPPQGTIVVALGAATPGLVNELQMLMAGGGVMPGGLKLFECVASGLTFGGGPIGFMIPQIPMGGINLTASDNIALVVTPGMQASYLPDVIDGMAFGLPAINGVIGAGPGIPDPGPFASGAKPTLSYQRNGVFDTENSQFDFTAAPRTPGWIAFGTPVAAFAAAPLTSSAIDLRVTPAIPGDMVMIAQSVDPLFDAPIHMTPYSPGAPIGPGGDMVVYYGPVNPGPPTIFDAPLPPSTPMYYRAWTVDPLMRYSAGTDSMGSTLAAPVAVPFSDMFPSPALNAVLWPYAPGASVDNGLLALAPPSPPNSAQLDYASGSAELASTGINATNTPNVKLTYFWQEGGAGDPPEPGEILQVEVLDPSLNWMPVMQHPATGGPVPFQPQEVIIPPFMLHSELRVRFVNMGISTTTGDLDHWFIDDVTVEEFPVLSGFQWQTVPTPVSAGIPFDVQLSALSSMGGILSNYMGDAILSLYETNGTPLGTLSPPTAFPFMQGVWSNTPLFINAEASSPVYLVATSNTTTGTSTVFQVLADVDGDNMRDSWEFQWFGSINVATNTPDSDHDTDGFPDHSEFVAGTLPLDSNSLLRVGFQQVGSASNILEWGSVSGRVYRVDRTTNLVTGFTTSLATNISATAPSNTYTDASLPSNAPVFYQLEVNN